MDLNDFDIKFRGLKQSDKIEMKCEHPECLDPIKNIGRESARRNIIKHGGTQFICGTCDKRFNNPMQNKGPTRKGLGEINVLCPGCNKTRLLQGVCYFGPLVEPYTQMCGSCVQVGKVISEEQKQKISEKLTGRELTEEHKANIGEGIKKSETAMESARKNLIPGIGAGWNEGKETPQEVRDKQSQAHLGKKYTDEHKLNISEGRKKMLDETGGFTLEHRQKLREAALRQYERGFDPHTHHRSGWHDSPKAGRVFHRSSYEKKAFMLLDDMPDVVTYTVENIRLTYWNPLSKTEAIFIVDILAKFTDDTEMAIEVKPTDWLTSLVNMAKIDALKVWAENEDCGCEIWDEFTLFGDDNTYKKAQQFLDWLDSGASGTIDNVSEDVIETRRAKSRIKAKRHYDKHLSKKLIVFCDHCKRDHEVREITYQQHMEKYGKYVCASQFGNMGGRPKNE